MTILKESNDCHGCTACKSICPVNAISMADDEEGFKRPVIDDSLCIHCNRCEIICPENKAHVNKSEIDRKSVV